MPPDYAAQHQQHAAPAPAQAGYKYDHYHGGPPGGSAVATATAAGANPPPSAMSGSHMHDGNGDVPMHDAGIKYPMRPHHQSHPSGSRASNAHPVQETSAAAQRYSPMDTLSPASPYTAKPTQFGNAPAQRQSPAKQGEYPQASYYGGRQQGQQLPPITPYASAQDGYPSSAVSAGVDSPFSADPKSPRRQAAPMPAPRGPVPEFRKIRGPADLRPKHSQQPPFRRANPEGGFISVGYPHYPKRLKYRALTAGLQPLQALTSHLPATYRICNPEFKYETSRNPRRVLTKPSKGVKNDGYDNEDSDYILYVNDILGSEEAGHKCVEALSPSYHCEANEFL